MAKQTCSLKPYLRCGDSRSARRLFQWRRLQRSHAYRSFLARVRIPVPGATRFVCEQCRNNLNKLIMKQERTASPKKRILSLQSKSQQKDRLRQFGEEIADVVEEDFATPSSISVDESKIVIQLHRDAEAKREDVDNVLRVLDDSLISRNQYRDLAGACAELPRAYLVESEKQAVNAKMAEMLPIGELFVAEEGKADGAFVRLKDLLPLILRCYRPMERVVVRIAIDGAKVGNYRKHLAFSICLPQIGHGVLELKNQLIFAIAAVDETERTVREVIRQTSLVEDMTALQADNVQFLLCSDWKMLALLMWTSPATATDFCVWCDCDKDQRGSTTSFPATHTLENLPAGFQPMLPIAYENVVLDFLHLRIRIRERLLKLLFSDPDLKGIDVINEFAKEKRIHLTVEKTKDGDVEWRFGDGGDLERIMDIDLSKCLPPARAAAVASLWKSFNDLLSRIRDNELEEAQARDWLQLFLDVYHKRDVTPYIHAMANHLPAMVQRLAAMGVEYRLVACDSLEKKHDQLKKEFFRRTSQGGLQRNADTEILQLRTST